LLKDQKERRKYLSEDTIWDMSRELSSALHHLHENNIIHRDIKTLNVFLTREKHVKLGDLGVSKIFNSDTAL
jgi:NIMA (never in mitosis gene a)-related kinase